MKKTIIAKLLLLFTFVFAVGCSKDDDSVNPLIVGKWKHDNTTVKITVAGQPISQTDTSPSDGSFVEFKSDGTCILDQENWSYKTKGNNITLTNSTGSVEFPVSVSNTRLTLSFNKSQFLALYKLSSSASDYASVVSSFSSISVLDVSINYIKQ